ncbi:MAG: TonB-dependent receptor plug domain-containing protein, partial [Candidatus Puniceispirillum sp.]
MKTAAIRVLLAGSCLLSGSLLAQTYELEDIVITAGNSPIARSHSATPHSIINRAAIEASGDISIRKLLGQVPGLTVSSSGNSTTQIRMRGGEANHTLVMINGISAAAGDGEYNFSGISAQDVERIEIFRGPQTVFFGPSASSGVINIITRSRLEDRLETSAQLGQTNRLYAAKSLQLGQMTGVASLLSEQDRGYDYSFANGEKDGIKRQTVEIRSNLITDNGIETALSFRRSDESYDIDDVNFGATSYRNYLTDSASSGDKDETLAAIQLAINSDDQKTRHEIRLQQTKFVDVYNGTRRSNSDKSVLGYQLQRSFTAQPISESTFTGALILEKNADRNRMSPVEKRNGDAVGV